MSFNRLIGTEDPPLQCCGLRRVKLMFFPEAGFLACNIFFNQSSPVFLEQCNDTMVQIFVPILRIKRLGFIIVKTSQRKNNKMPKKSGFLFSEIYELFRHFFRWLGLVLIIVALQSGSENLTPWLMFIPAKTSGILKIYQKEHQTAEGTNTGALTHRARHVFHVHQTM